MIITHNIPESLRAQKELCKKYAKEHPEDIMSEVMKNGIGYVPKNGVCLFCKQQIYAPTGMEYASIYRPTGRYVEGISIAKAREEITTSCPFCRNSFTEINVDKLYDW